jgi:RNA polymerase sigma-70 factor (ECF subfamily)
MYESRVSATSVDVGAAPGDAAGFAEWLRPSWAAMSALARRLDSHGEWEDVLQDSLSAAWRKRTQFDRRRGSARNWLLAIVADQAHKNRRRTRHGELADEPSVGVGVGVGVESRLDN